MESQNKKTASLNSQGCLVCQSEHRLDIESALMMGQTAAKVAAFYQIPIDHINNHKEICAAYLLSLDEFDAQVARELNTDPATGELFAPDNPHHRTPTIPGSIRRNLKLREGDLLAATADELFHTMKNLGRKINKFVDEAHTPDGLMEQQRFLRLPLCQMYVGIAGEIRQTVKTMADIDKQVNASESDNPISDLRALSMALHRSHEVAAQAASSNPSANSNTNPTGAQYLQEPLPNFDDNDGVE